MAIVARRSNAPSQCLQVSRALLVANRVEPADTSDRRAGALLLGGLSALFPRIRTIIADPESERSGRAFHAVPQVVSASLCVVRFLQVNWLVQNGAQTDRVPSKKPTRSARNRSARI